MENRVYINGLGSVSHQSEATSFCGSSVKEISQGLNFAAQPSYKGLIPPAMIRRMAKGVKMGIFASKLALEEAKLDCPEAIITGTGLGCLIDSENFLQNLLDNDEKYLTPTSFIQSTHNTVAGQLALHWRCKGYNLTYAHENISFESALLDGFLQLKSQELENALIGGVDEIAPTTMKHLQLAKRVNTVSDTFEKGINMGEGATFFVLSREKQESSYAELVDIELINSISEKDVTVHIQHFLAANKLDENDIDILVEGSTGLAVDGLYYSKVAALFAHSKTVSYKRFSGEYHTASAFGALLAAEMLKKQMVFSTQAKQSVRYVLLYNQFDGRDCSLILLRHVE